MLRLLLLLSALAACTPSPRKAVMPSPSPIAANTVQGSSLGSGGEIPHDRVATPRSDAMPGPVPEPVSAAGVAASPMPTDDSPAAASGRRTLSTAFVRVGPDGHLTVELHDGRILRLRDVTMGPTTYCGLRGGDDPAGKRFCGDYAAVAAARPGGAPLMDVADPGVGTSAKPATSR